MVDIYDMVKGNTSDPMMLYNGVDCAVTYELFDSDKSFFPELQDGYLDTYKFTLRLYEPLMYMMTKGIRVDREKLSEVKIDVSKRIKEKEEELLSYTSKHNYTLNYNSSQQCQEYFYSILGAEPYRKRDGNKYKITTDDKALQKLAKGTTRRAPIPEARIVQELRGLNKLFGTYLDIDFDEDNRFRSSINPRGTRTGRLSTGKTIYETGMNMQNLPEEFKKFLIADPGCLMFEIDKAKAEWVVVAYLTGDANMIKVIEEGLDPHIHTAHLMTHLPKDLIELEAKSIGHISDPFEIEKVRTDLAARSYEYATAFNEAKFIPRNMSIRQCGKKSNHGLNYDEGYKTFAASNEMIEADAKRVVDLYKHEAYPAIPQWYESIQRQLRKDRTLVNCFGRKYRFLGQWGDTLFKAAYAFLPQSTVADLINNGIILTYEDRSDYMKYVQPIGQVHDSILCQYDVRRGGVKGMAKALIKMRDYLNPTMSYGGRDFQIESDLKVGTVWEGLEEIDINLPEGKLEDKIGEAWSKACESEKAA